MAIVSWAHGDYPTAAKLNAYRDDLNTAHGAIGDAGLSLACEHKSSAEFYLTHNYRYLYWDSTGQIQSTDGTKTVGLSDPDTPGAAGQIDLDSIDWLLYGMMYVVTGVTWCMEDWE